MSEKRNLIEVLLEGYEKIGDGIIVRGGVESMWVTGKMTRQIAGQYTSDGGEGGINWKGNLPCNFYLEGVEEDVELSGSTIGIVATVFRRLAAELDTEIILAVENHEKRLNASDEISEATAERPSRRVVTVSPKKKTDTETTVY